MFRRLFWLSAIAGVGYAIWRLVRQQNEASPPAADAGRLYTPPTSENGARPTTLAPSGSADADAATPATGPRRIPTRVHRGSPPATPLPAEAPAAAAAEPAATETPEPESPARPDLPELSSLAATVADDLSELVGAAITGEQVVDLAPLVSPEAAAGAPELGTPLTNVNTADEAALIALPGIGPALARRIIAHREEHGPFTSVDQLDVIQGIGPRNIDEFRHLVTV